MDSRVSRRCVGYCVARRIRRWYEDKICQMSQTLRDMKAARVYGASECRVYE